MNVEGRYALKNDNTLVDIYHEMVIVFLMLKTGLRVVRMMNFSIIKQLF